MDSFPVYQEGELVRAYFNYPQLGPWDVLGVIIEPEPKDAKGYVKVLMQSTSKVDFVPYSCLEKVATD